MPTISSMNTQCLRSSERYLDSLNNLSEAPLVESVTGGKRGGGSRLTEHGRELVSLFRSLEKTHREQINILSEKLAHPEQVMDIARRLSLRSSARNQLFGRIRRIRREALQAEVILELKGGLEMAVQITSESLDRLGLTVGMEAHALIKSSWVTLATRDLTGIMSPRNQLAGRVARIEHDELGSEVVLELVGGSMLAASITRTSAEALGIEPGMEMWALIKANSILLGIG